MKIGSLVECIRGFDDPNCLVAISCGVIVPQKSKIYTIREVTHDDGIYLEEIINNIYDCNDGVCEPYFDIDNFRELLPPISNIEELINIQTIEIELV